MQGWRKFWKRFCGCFVFQSRVSMEMVVFKLWSLWYPFFTCDTVKPPVSDHPRSWYCFCSWVFMSLAYKNSRPSSLLVRRTSAIYCLKFHTDDVHMNFVTLHKLSFAVLVKRNQRFFNPSLHTTHGKFVPNCKRFTFSHMYQRCRQLMRSTWRIKTKLACQQVHLNLVVPKRPMEE